MVSRVCYARMGTDEQDEREESEPWPIEQEPGFCDETRRSRISSRSSRTRTRGVRSPFRNKGGSWQVLQPWEEGASNSLSKVPELSKEGEEEHG